MQMPGRCLAIIPHIVNEVDAKPFSHRLRHPSGVQIPNDLHPGVSSLRSSTPGYRPAPLRGALSRWFLSFVRVASRSDAMMVAVDFSPRCESLNVVASRSDA